MDASVVINLEGSRILAQSRKDRDLCEAIGKIVKISLRVAKISSSICAGLSLASAPIVFLKNEEVAAVWMIAAGLSCMAIFCIFKVLENALFPVKRGQWIFSS